MCNWYRFLSSLAPQYYSVFFLNLAFISVSIFILNTAVRFWLPLCTWPVGYNDKVGVSEKYSRILHFFSAERWFWLDLCFSWGPDFSDLSTCKSTGHYLIICETLQLTCLWASRCKIPNLWLCKRWFKVISREIKKLKEVFLMYINKREEKRALVLSTLVF